MRTNLGKFINEKSLANTNDFIKLCNRTTNKDDYHYAEYIIKNVVIYDADKLNKHIENNVYINEIKSEFNYCLDDGPGVFVVKNLQKNKEIIKAANNSHNIIIQEEKEKYQDKSDHFSSGSNDRIWNSFEKFCYQNPIDFINYYANPLLDIICHSWVGPYYQMTAQVNVVNPGGKAQVVHRDYHMGFQDKDTMIKFPLNAHKASNYLTLQGAIAHTKIPKESGSTYLLPFSHSYNFGYLAVNNDFYINYFNENYIQLDINEGDGLFFNPALFHAAGANKTKDIIRSVNLLQISSPFGKAMEVINRKKMVKTIYPYLIELNLDARELETIINMVADGYPFPANLDDNPPYNNTLKSAQDITKDAVLSKKPADSFNTIIDGGFFA